MPMPGPVYVQLSPLSCHKLVSYGDTAIWLSQDAAVGTSSCLIYVVLGYQDLRDILLLLPLGT